jgi:DNA-directed RNA polymerase, mitochondrial
MLGMDGIFDHTHLPTENHLFSFFFRFADPIPPHFSNVGSDLCRGMLTFADAKPLGKRGLYWLKVHLANFAGKDKMSFDDRAKYVDDNMEHVRASAKDPFSEDPWWKTLDDPFQGVSNENMLF